MGTAGPMNQQNDLGGIVIKICHHFLDHRANDTLFKLGICHCILINQNPV
ncbi:hypothetical protein CLV74_1417 [Donghicola tyrosinivorans]|uniref:Uncharacterized protein n=1 Tax=Donghicola tyrosinivorans TaxID=1652492 RepID=A0A2T0W7I0_9RHOB|nr:hypothetical protein CLV74_1417 [Donghicola tyrosinivorans]